MCSVENMQRGETNTTSVSVYCIFATVTYKTQMRKYTDITDLQCKDCGDRKALKCQELLKHDSIAYSFFMRENNTWLLILTLSFLCFSGVATVSNLSFSPPAIVCHRVGIPAALVSFLHCFYILVEGLSLLIHHASKFPEK